MMPVYSTVQCPPQIPANVPAIVTEACFTYTVGLKPSICQSALARCRAVERGRLKSEPAGRGLADPNDRPINPGNPRLQRLWRAPSELCAPNHKHTPSGCCGNWIRSLVARLGTPASAWLVCRCVARGSCSREDHSFWRAPGSEAAIPAARPGGFGSASLVLAGPLDNSSTSLWSRSWPGTELAHATPLELHRYP